MAWTLLLLAGVFEIIFAVGLKYTEGFTKFLPSVITCICAIISFMLLNWSIRTLPVGTAYAVWTGIGALGTATYGIFVFGEPSNVARIVCLSFIFIGVVGLNLVSETTV